jgi:hypothetical protein
MLKLKLIVLYIIMVIFASCEYPVMMEIPIIDDVESPDTIPDETNDEEKEPVDIAVITDAPDNTTDNTADPLILMEEIKMELQSIKVCDRYFVTDGGGIYGITGAGIEPITILDADDNAVTPLSFEVVDGKIMIVVKTIEQGKPIADTDPVEYEAVEVLNYFTQINGVMSVATADDCPAQPDAQAIELNESPFRIESGLYDETAISNVFNTVIDGETTKELQIAYLPVTGAEKVDGGLWYNVSDTFSIRTAGLYYWKENTNSPVLMLNRGRLW